MSVSSVGDLQGLRAFVTGGGRGLGAAIALGLAQRGADVTIAGRTEQVLAEAAATHQYAYHVVDVCDEASVSRAFQSAGEFDILVNNAGGTATAPFLDIEPDAWNQTLALNLTGAFLCCRAALRGMVARGSGRIVNIASTGGLAPYRYVAAYVAAKHGLIGLTRALALETAQTGVTVNAVCPGYADTDMVRSGLDRIVAKTRRSRNQALAGLLKGNPQGKLVEPADVAATVAWLCLPTSVSVTGQSIVIAGGEIMH